MPDIPSHNRFGHGYFHVHFTNVKEPKKEFGDRLYNVKNNSKEFLKLASYFTVIIPGFFLAKDIIIPAYRTWKNKNTNTADNSLEKKTSQIFAETSSPAIKQKKIEMDTLINRSKVPTPQECEEKGLDLAEFEAYCEIKVRQAQDSGNKWPEYGKALSLLDKLAKKYREKSKIEEKLLLSNPLTSAVDLIKYIKKSLTYYELVAKEEMYTRDKPQIFNEIGNVLKQQAELLAQSNEGDASLSLDEAKKYYEKAAEGRVPQAFNSLGELELRQENVLPSNIDKALDYFKKAAEKGMGEAFNNIGKLARSEETTLEQLGVVIDLLNDQGSSDSIPNEVDDNNSESTIKNRIAETAFFKAKDLGIANASSNLGEMHQLNLMNIKGTKGSNAKLALANFKEGAEKNDPDALNNLGKIYEGQGDYKQAFESFSKAWRGSQEASYHLGRFYLTGTGCKKNVRIARICFEIAAKKGNKDALVFLGEIYEKGLGVPKKGQLAKQYYELAGTEKAKVHLGQMYRYGNSSVERDQDKAKEYFEEVINENPENTEALNCLGEMYKSGEMGKVEEEIAYNYFLKAMDLKDGRAFTNIGEMLREGKMNFLTTPKEAVKKITGSTPDALLNKKEKPEEKGLFSWGVKIFEGASSIIEDIRDIAIRGIEDLLQTNTKKAFEYFQRGAALGDARALNNLGEMYWEGKIPGEPADKAKAMQYFNEAKEKGDIRALNNLAEAYLQGINDDGKEIEKTLDREDKTTIALFLIKDAAQQRDSKALNNMAKIYEFGKAGIDSDLEKAIQYYKFAIKVNTTDVEAREGYARCLLKQPDNQENKLLRAQLQLETAGQLGSFSAFNTLGEQQLKTSHIKEAKHYYKKSLEIERNEEALSKLGQIALAEEGFKAKTALEKIDVWTKNIEELEEKKNGLEEEFKVLEQRTGIEEGAKNTILDEIQKEYDNVERVLEEARSQLDSAKRLQEEVSLEEGLDLLTEATAYGNAEAECALAEIQESENITKDPEIEKEVLSLYQASADKKNPVALYRLGLLNLQKKTLNKSQLYREVFPLFEESAKQGNLVGAFYLADLYEKADSKETGTLLDPIQKKEEAKKLYRQIIERSSKSDYQKPLSAIRQQEEAEAIRKSKERLEELDRSSQ